MTSRSKAPPPRAARAATAQASSDAVRDVPDAASEALSLLTADDLAAAWGVRTRYIYELARDRGLPCVKLGRYRRFRASAVEAWLTTQEGRNP